MQSSSGDAYCYPVGYSQGGDLFVGDSSPQWYGDGYTCDWNSSPAPGRRLPVGMILMYLWVLLTSAGGMFYGVRGLNLAKSLVLEIEAVVLSEYASM